MRASLLGFAVVVGMTVLFAGGISTAQPKVLTLKAFDKAGTCSTAGLTGKRT